MSGLAGREALVARVQELVEEARGPVWLTGAAGSGSTAIAAAVADGLARRGRVLGVACTDTTSFTHLAETLADGLGQGDASGPAIVLTGAGRVAEPGFLRALAHLTAAVPDVGWLIAGADRGMPGAREVAVPLLSEADMAAAVDGAIARRSAAISRIARATAATLARGLPGLADRLVAGAWDAARAAGEDGIGLPQLRAAARGLAGPEIAAEAPDLRRAAARTPRDADGTFPRDGLAIALERAGLPRAVAPERDGSLVAAGRGRLRFRDDAEAASLLLSEFGWTRHHA